MSILTVSTYRLLGSCLTLIWVDTLDNVRIGTRLKQEQKVQLAQIIHQAIHPWPIYNDMQRLPCSRSTEP